MESRLTRLFRGYLNYSWKYLFHSGMAGFAFFGLSIMSILFGVSYVLLIGNSMEVFKDTFPTLIPYFEVIDETYPSYLVVPLFFASIPAMWAGLVVLFHHLDHAFEDIWNRIEGHTLRHKLNSYWLLASIFTVPFVTAIVLPLLSQLNGQDNTFWFYMKVVEFVVIFGIFATYLWFFCQKTISWSSLWRSMLVTSIMFSLNSTYFLSYLLENSLVNQHSLLICAFFLLTWSLVSMLIFTFSAKLAMAIDESNSGSKHLYSFKELNLLCLLEMSKKLIANGKNRAERIHLYHYEFSKLAEITLKEAREIMNYLHLEGFITMMRYHDGHYVGALNISPYNLTMKDFLTTLDKENGTLSYKFTKSPDQPQNDFWSDYDEMLEQKFGGLTLKDLIDEMEAEEDVYEEEEEVVEMRKPRVKNIVKSMKRSKRNAPRKTKGSKKKVEIIHDDEIDDAEDYIDSVDHHDEVFQNVYDDEVDEVVDSTDSILDRIRKAS
ncbi:MAG: hypothetical protein ISR65_03235 [Bacteriovoracaceae bacterium]|nr:hypothetical protein [Bacteriovoracaceae bacterium]